MGLNKRIVVIDKYPRTYKKLIYLLGRYGISETDLERLPFNKEEVNTLTERCEALESEITRLNQTLQNLVVSLNNNARRG